MNETPPAGVSWHVYVDRRLEDFAKQMDERFNAQKEAVRAYSESNQRALEKVNEFRQSLTDQNARFATVEGVRGIETRIGGAIDRISALERASSRLEGQTAQAEANARAALVKMGLGLVVLQIVLAVVFKLLWK